VVRAQLVLVLWEVWSLRQGRGHGKLLSYGTRDMMRVYSSVEVRLLIQNGS
jgi:hypothetical protein